MSISDGDYELAIKIVLESSNASCSHLQRKLNWGYARASMAIDRMEREFIVGAMSTAGKRDVLPPCVHELWEKSQQQEKEIQALKRPLKLEKVLVLMDQFKKTRTFKLFYSTLFRFNEDLDCFVSTEKWRDKEAELLTATWWMFAEVAKHQAVPEGFVLVPYDVVDRCMSHIVLAQCHPNNTSGENDVMEMDLKHLEQSIEQAQGQSHE